MEFMRDCHVRQFLEQLAWAYWDDESYSQKVAFCQEQMKLREKPPPPALTEDEERAREYEECLEKAKLKKFAFPKRHCTRFSWTKALHMLLFLLASVLLTVLMAYIKACTGCSSKPSLARPEPQDPEENGFVIRPEDLERYRPGTP